MREDQALGGGPRPQTPWLRGYRCRYRQPQYSDDLFQRHGVPLPLDLSSAVPGRKAEFLAGRHAAQKALQRWGLEGGMVSIGRHRCPVWPIGWVGSITHDGATAISAAACAVDCPSLGIDLATWFSAKDAVSLAGYIVQREETRILAECALTHAHALTLAFSAKESLFKAMFPIVGSYFDFHALELLVLDLDRGGFRARTRINLGPSLGAGTSFQGAILLGFETVFTAAWRRRGEPGA